MFLTRRRRALPLLGFMALVTVFLVTACGATGTKGTSNGAVTFKGKRITIVVGSSAGGGYDLVARVFAKYVTKYLPGSPQVVVENIPAGAQLQGMQTAMKANPDGLTIGMMAPRWTIDYVMGIDVEGLDFVNAKYIGTATGTERSQVTCVPKSFATNFQDAVAKAKAQGIDIKSGESAPGSISGIITTWLGSQGYPFKAVTGYPGASDIDAAIHSGELLALENCETPVRAFRYPEWENNYWTPLWRIGPDQPEPDFQSVLTKMGVPAPPLLSTLVNIPSDVQLGFDVLFKTDQYTRTFFLPPKTPDDISQVWDTAFDKISKDPSFVSQLQSTAQLSAQPVAGATVQNTFNQLRAQVAALPADEQAKLRTIMEITDTTGK